MSESDEFYRRQKVQRAAAKRLAKSQDERDKGVTQLEKLSDTCLRNVNYGRDWQADVVTDVLVIMNDQEFGDVLHLAPELFPWRHSGSFWSCIDSARSITSFRKFRTWEIRFDHCFLACGPLPCTW